MGLFAALDRGRTSAALLSAALLLPACLPRDDLSDYSANPGGIGGSSGNGSTPEGEDAGNGPSVGQGGGEPNPEPMLPLDPGGADASSAGLEDAGPATLDAAAPAQDAGATAMDAGPIANVCSSTQGTLEPGSTVCIFVASLARVTWQAAVLACQSRNSTLVSVKTTARNNFLSTLIDSDVWLGGNDPGTNPASNLFVWRDGSAVAPIGWAATEPDAVADQFCIAKTAEAQAPWRDRPCSELKAYICEQTL